MTMAPDTRSASAKQAFSAYADLVRTHANVPTTFDDPERVAERRAAYAKLLDAFGGAR